MNSFTYTDFYNKWLGKSSQLGGYYNQCVTLFKCFLEEAGYPNPGRAIGGSGGAREIWYRRDDLGYSDYFEYTQVGQPGDWFIWDQVYGWYKGVYYGHVAMLIKDNGNGTGQFLGMNQDYSQAPASVQTLTYNGSCGVLHYKGYGTATQTTSSSFDPSQMVEENAVATFTVDKLNARVNGPDGTVCRQYNSGDSVEYHYKWVGNGHRYICWYEGSNIIMVAVSESEDYSSTRWATFETKETSTSDNLIDEHGFAKYKVDGVNLRKDSVTGDIVKIVNSGDVIEYTQKCVTNGHRYISYADGDTRYYIACSPSEEQSNDWCDFYAENPSSTNTKQDETKDQSTNNTNGFSSVNEGEYENHNQIDESLSYDGVTVDLISKDLYSYKCPYTMTPKTVVIHNAATSGGTAKTLNQYLHNHKDYKSWHFTVDDKDIYESLPLNRNAFATGDGAYGLGNRTGIHIEITKDMDNDSVEEWQAARKNGAKLTAILLQKYGWDISKVTKHQDYKMSDGTYKYCPHKILDEGWEDFIELVQSELDELNSNAKEKADPSTDSTGSTDSSPDNIEDKKNTLIDLLVKLIRRVLKLFK